MKTQRIASWFGALAALLMLGAFGWNLLGLGEQPPEESGKAASERDLKIPAQTNEHNQAIMIERPEADTAITSPVAIRGTAPRGWFFSNGFFVSVKDANGTVLGRGIALAAQSNTAGDAVPFQAAVGFNSPETETGELVFQSANPDDQTEEETVTLPVRFVVQDGKG